VKTVPLGQLVALPLQAAVRAQALTSAEFLSAIEQFGVEEGSAKIFRLKVERTVEQTVVNPKTGETTFEPQTHVFEVRIPVLALINPPGVRIQEMNAEFSCDVHDLKADVLKISLANVPQAVSLASSPASLARSGKLPVAMKISMKILPEKSEGFARLYDVLVDTMTGRPAKP
jgi:hypothetical protein